ncbi:MAG TPA: methionyl-tRNA formyltransferase, partial [Candidatus Binatia bacterium]|nr:methionyl-tRNA formyltransferase [Candidatus Binatia bacterium]
DQPAGRKGEMRASPVALAARESLVPVLQPQSLKDETIQGELAALRADLFLVAAYGKIVPKAMLALPRLGCLNLHGSILPKYRGASPIQAAIAAGEEQTGVTLMKMDELVDHGPVYAVVTVPIEPSDTYGSLEKKLADAAAEMLTSHLEDLSLGKLKPKAQHHDDATFTKIIGREEAFVAWAELDAAAIERRRRAFDPWPGLYAVWVRKGAPMRLKLLDVCAKKGHADLKPGTVYVAKDGTPAVAAKHGAVCLFQVQPEGKKPMDGKAFLNGYPDFKDAVLELEDPSAKAQRTEDKA